MSQEKRNYKFISDPGHGWLSVPLQDLVELNIASEISTYSYMTTTRAYLEEDQDFSIFLHAAKKADWSLTYKDSTVEKTAIRNYASYTPEKLELALSLKTGSPLSLYNTSTKEWSTKASVVGFEDNKIQIQCEYGNNYQVSKNKFLSVIKPRALTPEDTQSVTSKMRI